MSLTSEEISFLKGQSAGMASGFLIL